jgi:hypothetical protein
MSINTLVEMRNYIKAELGYPVINVEVADSQIDQVIDKASRVMNKYSYGEGVFLDYAIFTTTPGKAYYELSGVSGYEDIQEIVDFHLSFGGEGINSLFSPTDMLMQGLQGEDGQFGLGGTNNNPGLELTTYYVAQMYIQEIQQLFGKLYSVKWIPGRKVLHIVPTPAQTLTGTSSGTTDFTINNYSNHQKNVSSNIGEALDKIDIKIKELK